MNALQSIEAIVTTEIAEGIAKNLQATDGEAAKRRACDLRQLEQRRNATAMKLDRGYDDFVSGKISEEFWTRKSQEWEAELQTVEATQSRLQLRRHPRPLQPKRF